MTGSSWPGSAARTWRPFSTSLPVPRRPHGKSSGHSARSATRPTSPPTSASRLNTPMPVRGWLLTVSVHSRNSSSGATGGATGNIRARAAWPVPVSADTVDMTSRLVPSDRPLGEGLRAAVVRARFIAWGFGILLHLGPHVLAAGTPGRDGQGDPGARDVMEVSLSAVRRAVVVHQGPDRGCACGCPACPVQSLQDRVVVGARQDNLGGFHARRLAVAPYTSIPASTEGRLAAVACADAAGSVLAVAFPGAAFDEEPHPARAK